MSRRWLLAGVLGGTLLLIGGAVIVAWQASPWVHDQVVESLAARLDSEVTLESFEVSFVPRPAFVGRGLVIRYQGRTDIPPFIAIRAFSGTTDLTGVLRRRAREVRLEGLAISVPPRRGEDLPDATTSGDGNSGEGRTFIDRLVSENARLSILSKDPQKTPKVFDIFTLEMRDVGLAAVDARPLEDARFGSRVVQDQVDELSRRGRGTPDDESVDDIASDMQGAFALKDGMMTIPQVTFEVTGATVQMAGVYGLRGGTLDFHGDVRLDAPVSEMLTGVRSWLLKPFDALFRKQGAGTRVAIKVEGTKDDPTFGIEIGRTLTGK